MSEKPGKAAVNKEALQSEITETRKITTFHTPDSWDTEVEKAGKGESFTAYARYMYPEEEKREREFAEMIHVPDVALLNSGMAAIVTAVEAEELHVGDTVLVGKEVYASTKELYASLIQRGITVVEIDSGNMEQISAKIDTYRPRLVILESVTNDPSNPEMQVCDMGALGKLIEEANGAYKEKASIHYLLKYALSKKEYYSKLPDAFEQKLIKSFAEYNIGHNPFIFRNLIRDLAVAADISNSEAIRELAKILKYLHKNYREKLSLIVDNTLPSPHLYNITNETKDFNFELTVVESGTKHFQKGQGKITMGIAYSNDARKVKKIKQTRAALGTYLQPTSEREIPEDITQTMSEIVKRHAENALSLAKMLDHDGLDVMHPNLEKHKQSDFANEISPQGIVTLFYIKFSDDSRAKEFVDKVYSGGSVKVGASFGHLETSILREGSIVRVAAGQESVLEFEKVKSSFKHAVEKV